MFHCLHFKALPIYEQLQIEEALLRLDDRNWCIINEGSPDAVVMGISGKPEELVNLPALHEKNIPLIKRYSGGGTVIVDHDTVFVSMLCKAALHLAKPYPESIMKWSESLYKSVICHNDFSLCENDFAIGNLKFGGNAQYITKSKWMHHTTLLWDYEDEKMDLLKLPAKRPKYRSDRTHSDFLCRLKNYMVSKEALVVNVKETLSKRYGLEEVDVSLIQDILSQEHRKSTRIIDVGCRLQAV